MRLTSKVDANQLYDNSFLDEVDHEYFLDRHTEDRLTEERWTSDMRKEPDRNGLASKVV